LQLKLVKPEVSRVADQKPAKKGKQDVIKRYSYFWCILLLKCLKSAPCIARMDTSHDVKPMPSAMEGR
jgi:hypothetical protein